MKKFLACIFLTISLHAGASHIVGGEFQMIHVQGYQYRFNLVLYFDVINNGFGGVPPEQMEPTISAAIFGNASTQALRTVTMNFISRTPLPSTHPWCATNVVETEVIVYSAIVTLAPEQYDDPMGYYIVWERCCRNYTITNILSQPPVGNNSPNSAGQTFLLEFPPVTKDGSPFVNSSPKLFPALADYACPNRLYYTDFSALDDDGDSIAYSLVTPLSTHQTTAVPIISAKPFPQVTWVPPFGLNNVMNGAPDLSISKKGLLTVRPTELGLFSFAVRVEEFRDGVKIGEVRREFQIFVLDACPPAVAPEISGRTLAGSFTSERIDVEFSSATPDNERCVVVKVEDDDVLSPEGFQQVHIRAVPLDFSGNVSNILPPVTSALLYASTPSAEFSVCFSQCNPWEVSDFEVGIIAYDHSCSLPLQDTVKIKVHMVTAPPVISARTQTGSFVTGQLDVEFSGDEQDEERCVVVKVDDADAFGVAQPISIKAIPLDFSMDISEVLPTVTSATLTSGASSAEFSICFSKCPPLNRSEFLIGIVVHDECNRAVSDTVAIKVKMPQGCLQQTIDFPAIADRTIGSTHITLNAVASSGLPVSYVSSDPTRATIDAGTVLLQAAGTVTITASQEGNNEYIRAESVSRSFCINPQPPQITVEHTGTSSILVSDNQTGNIWYKDDVELHVYNDTLEIEDELALYSVRLRVNGCMSPPSNTILITSAEEHTGKNIAVFPNPAHNVVTIRRSGSTRNAKLELTDLLGKVIMTENATDEFHTIDVSKLLPGIYLVKVSDGESIVVEKVLKQNQILAR